MGLSLENSADCIYVFNWLYLTLSYIFFLHQSSVSSCDLWQQLELASEVESYLRDIGDWDMKWLFNFNDYCFVAGVNSMPCSGCTALHEVNPNFKKSVK